MYKERKFFLQGGQISLFSGGSNLYEQAVFLSLTMCKNGLACDYFCPSPPECNAQEGEGKKKSRARPEIS